MKPRLLRYRVLTGLITPPAAPDGEPADTSYPLFRRVLAGLLGVALPKAPDAGSPLTPAAPTAPRLSQTDLQANKPLRTPGSHSAVAYGATEKMPSDRLPVPHVDPDRVWALIVGIERYEVGRDWNLPGAAQKAVSFRQLLHDAGVPEDQLLLHLAPLPSYVPGIPYASADQATLRHVLINQLRLKQGDIMWVWWGGRGATDLEGQRRLFTSDATIADKVGFNLDSVLRLYTSDAVRSFAEQMWMVDASEAIGGSRPSGEPFPREVTPLGSPSHAHQQAVLYATGRSRGGAKYTAPGNGSFSDILLELLADRSAVLPAPPDANELFTAAGQRIAGIAKQGQTPIQAQFRLQRRRRTRVLRPETPLLPAASLRRFVDALLSYPQMTDRAARETLLGMMRPELVDLISRQTTPRMDLYSIVLTAQRYGVLQELFEAMLLIDDDPVRRLALQEALYSPENLEENRTESE